MADARHQAVMHLRLEHHGMRPHGRDQRLQPRLGAGENPGGALEKVGVRGFQARSLAAAHGMTADQLDAGGCRPAHHLGLGAGEVRDQRSAAGQAWEQVAHRQHGDRQHHQVRRRGGVEIRTGHRHQVALQRPAQRELVAIDADQRQLRPGSLERHGQGPAHQAQADHGDGVHRTYVAPRRGVRPRGERLRAWARRRPGCCPPPAAAARSVSRRPESWPPGPPRRRSGAPARG